MSCCVEYIDKKTLKYRYSYSLKSSPLSVDSEYYYISLRQKIIDNKKIFFGETGLIDPYSLNLIPCNIKLGHIYVNDVICTNQEKVNWSRSENTLYCFSFILYDRKYKSYQDYVINATFHEFAGIIQVLNYYIDNDFDLNSIHIDKLQNKYHYNRNCWGVEPYTVLDISKNIEYYDFYEFILNCDNTAWGSCSYSFRKGEYAHDYGESLIFKTKNIVFIEIIKKILQTDINREENFYTAECKFVDKTDYNGGISVMVEEEGRWETEPKGDFKKRTIRKIINESLKHFPSDLYIICKLLSDDNSFI